MYKLNPPIWYLKSTINNLKILHQARRLRAQERSSREQPQTISPNENVYSFWIDFFSDAIDSSSQSTEESELPAQLPILFCDNYEKSDGAIIKNVYVEAYLQLNFHTGDEPETLVIRILDQQKGLSGNELVKIIEMNSIRSIIDVKYDNRAIFFYAYESSRTFSVAELQIFFSSTERRAAFNRKMSKYRGATAVPEDKLEFDLEFERGQHGQRIALGTGVSGRVYLARDRLTCKKFAVKEIQKLKPSHAEVLENEIKILSMLNHKNIVSYYGTAIDSTKKPHIFQIIMEYVDGGSLSNHLAKFGQFPETAIRNYTRQILEGLQYLHETHILHRDIKSDNILINSRGEIKIADFGTSKRLSGLHLCREDTVGTIPNMCPEVVLVSPMGYGPEVDIWSVGCTVIEMASGKRPFHNIQNNCAILFKLGSDKLPPEIPPELSDVAKDFLARCFEPKDRRPSAKDLLNHPFCSLPRTKSGLPREISVCQSGDRHETAIRLSDSAPCLHRSSSEDAGMVFEPARDLTPQISVDDCRRHELANILREDKSRNDLIARWLSLIEEKNETELLHSETLSILLTGICNFLDSGRVEVLEEALNKVCDRSTMDSDIRIDLERSFYLFIKAANNVLASRNLQAPHVLFALDNIMRRVAEHLVGLIRPDFIPADSNMLPMTPNNELLQNGSYPRTPSTSSLDGVNNDELARLHHQYRKIAERNREQLQHLIKIESNNSMELNDLLVNQQNGTSDAPKEFFLAREISSNGESPSPQNSPVASSTQRTNGTPHTPTNGTPHILTNGTPHTPTRGIKRSRAVLDLELEHERLLKDLIDNRTRISEVLHS